MVKYVLLMLLIQKLQISRLSKKYYVLLHIIDKITHLYQQWKARNSP